jgi:hypothetical protein
VRLLPDWFISRFFSPRVTEPLPLTRKALYDLAAETREIATRLARYDQHRVDLQQCHEFNAWYAETRRYDLLVRRLGAMPPARPISRTQIIIIAVLIGLLSLLVLPPQVGPLPGSYLLYAYFFSIIAFFFVPESLYGTSIELLEAKMLRIVESLEEILQNEPLDFTEAAYFHTKDNLEAAKRELRQQLDLAHRARRG